MINNPNLTVKQAEVIKAMRAHFGKKNPVSRTEMVEYCQTKLKQAYAPGFIVKNEAFKARDKEGKEIRGMYKLPAAVASKESIEKAKAAAKAPKATTKATSTKKAAKTPTVKRVGGTAPTQAAKDRAAALEAAASATERLNNDEPEQTTAAAS